MKQHLIVLDLDGTLLTDQKVISPKTKLTLNKALETGHQVMIATGLHTVQANRITKNWG